MKKIYLISVLIIMILSFAVVNAEINEFAEAEKLVQDKIPCSELNNLQLESVGDYYMEKMHPGEAHEIMESMMGGEGSESLRQIHIGIAKSFYCGENRINKTLFYSLITRKIIICQKNKAFLFAQTAEGNL